MSKGRNEGGERKGGGGGGTCLKAINQGMGRRGERMKLHEGNKERGGGDR